MAHTEKIEFENERVKVTRVSAAQRGHSAHNSRHDRLIIYLRDGHVLRTEKAKTEKEEVRHRAGDVVWRPSSEHQVEYVKEGDHEVLIVELKN